MKSSDSRPSLAIPAGDAPRLGSDIKYLFRHFADRGASAKLRPIIDRLPGDSEIQRAAHAGIGGWEADLATEKASAAVLARAQALLTAHSYQEARQLADRTDDEAIRWQVLRLITRQLMKPELENGR